MKITYFKNNFVLYGKIRAVSNFTRYVFLRYSNDFFFQGDQIREVNLICPNYCFKGTTFNCNVSIDFLRSFELEVENNWQFIDSWSLPGFELIIFYKILSHLIYNFFFKADGYSNAYYEFSVDCYFNLNNIILTIKMFGMKFAIPKFSIDGLNSKIKFYKDIFKPPIVTLKLVDLDLKLNNSPENEFIQIFLKITHSIMTTQLLSVK